MPGFCLILHPYNLAHAWPGVRTDLDEVSHFFEPVFLTKNGVASDKQVKSHLDVNDLVPLHLPSRGSGKKPILVSLPFAT